MGRRRRLGWLGVVFGAAGCGPGVTHVEDVPPTLTEVQALSGATEDSAFAITHQALAGAADEASSAGRPISFRLEEILSGVLQAGSAAASAGDLLAPDGDPWSWTPPADASGTLAAFSIVALDGALESDDPVEVRVVVAAVNDAPVLTAMDTLTGADSGVPYAISAESLLSASDADDIEGDAIAFRVESVASGTLQLGAAAVVPGTTLVAAGGDDLMWTPPVVATGDIAAFSVRAHDGELASAAPVTVSINVVPSGRPTLTAIAPLTGVLPDVPFTITYPILAGLADESDPEADPLAFRVESVSVGTLEQSGAPVTPGTSVLDAGSAPWVFTHDAEGTFAAFTVVVTDGTLASLPPVTVEIELAAPGAFAPEWIGGISVGVPWTTSGTPAPGRGDGAFDQPTDALVVGTFLYVADSANHRITRFNATTGVFAGWIGRIASSPIAGDPGCGGAAPGTFTPGWCFGGTATFNTFEYPFFGTPFALAAQDGVLYVANGSNGVLWFDIDTGAFLGEVVDFYEGSVDLALDATHLYVVGENRVTRVLLATGALDGWTGRVGAVPPTSCAGGATPASGEVTNDWCLGGEAQSGSGDGAFNGTIGVALFEDPPGTPKLAVADAGNSRLVRLDASSGAFEGWLGTVSSDTPALGGDCAGQSVGYVAQGWCQGGATGADLGPRLGGFSSMGGTHAAAGVIYQSSGGEVLRYDAASGAFQGWVGLISLVAPTSCLSGVPSPFESVPTGSWCLGGTAGGAPLGVLGDLTLVVSVTTDPARLFAVDRANYRVHAFDLTSGAPIAWLGGQASAVSAWSTNDAPGPAAGALDGMLGSASAVVVHAASDSLFVAGAGRVNRFVASTGAFAGWTGRTETMPESCDGPLPAVVPGPTGGWCRGGTSNYGIGDGEYEPVQGLALHGDYLLVSEPRRVQRFTLDGASAGWIGNVANPTGIGPASCAGALQGDFTPDWCTGGQAGPSLGMETGQLGGIAVFGDTLYATDSRNVVDKITITDGAVTYDGWNGRVGPNPGDVPLACDGVPLPAAGAATFGWCLGGAPASGSDDGMFSSPSSVATDGAGNVYVNAGYRLSKLAPSGAFLGWLGAISVSPTGPAGPCVGAVGVTPGFCTGGTATFGSADGGFSNPRGITLDASAGRVYVANGYRIDRFDAATGAFLGWAGKLATQPTGGDLGCTTAPLGALGPGWCTGGSAADGTNNGDLSPSGVSTTATHLYVADFDHHRVTRLLQDP